MLAQRRARRQRRVGVITSGLPRGSVGVGGIGLGVEHLGEDVGADLGCGGAVRLTGALQREQRQQRLRVARLPRYEGRLRLLAGGEEEGAG